MIIINHVKSSVIPCLNVEELRVQSFDTGGRTFGTWKDTIMFLNNLDATDFANSYVAYTQMRDRGGSMS